MSLSLEPAHVMAQTAQERAAARAEKKAARAAKREAKRRAREAQPAAEETAAPSEDELSEPTPSTNTTVGASGVLVADPELESSSGGGGGGEISDPELAGVVESGGGDVISDPELGGSAQDSDFGATPSENNTGRAKLVLRSRFAADLYRADPREEVWENVTLAEMEITLRASENLRFVLGVRARYHWATLAADVPDAQASRLELDAAPTSAFVDVKLGEGAHLQLGYQPVHLGRFDLLSAINVLSVYDLREGVALFPETSELGQLAARLDVDISSWLSMRVIYVPFFTPDIISVTESDYALFRANQSTIDAGLDSLDLTAAFAANLSRADRALIAESALAAFGPEPTLDSQQAAIRFDMHGTLGELGITAVTALEHLPSFRASQELIDATLDPSADAQERLALQPRPATVEYGRFAVFSIDGSIDLAPVQVGFELAYMLNRTLWAVGEGPFPLDLPVPESADIAHVGLRVEYVQGSEWLFVLESFFSYVLQIPADPQLSWMFLQDGRWAAGVGTAVAWTSEFGLGIELAAFGFSDLSLFFMPRVSYELFDGFAVELGAMIVEGDSPPPTITPNVAIGGLFDTVDFAFLGLRYTP
jgi:hypothetical protein